MIDAARRYRALGLSVIPVSRDKHPLVPWKTYQLQPAHPIQVDDWWKRWPEANIGTVTGAVSGLVVLDADGPEGLTSLTSLRPRRPRGYLGRAELKGAGNSSSRIRTLAARSRIVRGCARISTSAAMAAT
jgi:hypothetical protein